SLPLIASSIMSKKLAAGSRSIVLDVKVGSGAFMQTYEDARALAEEMVAIGKHCGRQIAAGLTDMNTPLGTCVGNALEVAEAAMLLRGSGSEDLREVCLTLSANMLALVHGCTPEAGRAMAEDALNSGAAFETLKRWIAAQGGDASVLEEPARLPQAAVAYEVTAASEGYITKMDARRVGEASVLLGAGRATKEDTIDPAAGLRLHAKTGDFVRHGDVLAVLYTNDASSLARAEEMLRSAYSFGAEQSESIPLIYGIVR
ncbi:MAG: thymidine phosphorylase, partial [Oscillospiraceae bacterium]|nr:thymidine phosphorylase [Oscillospiraceae bacterium]